MIKIKYFAAAKETAGKEEEVLKQKKNDCSTIIRLDRTGLSRI